MERRYSPGKFKPRRTAVLWERDEGMFLQLLQGHASQSKTRHGRLFNLRIRLIRRFGFSPWRTPDPSSTP
jgi:hypothetical protein